MLSEEIQQTIAEILNRYPRKEAALIPALHVVQKKYGYIPDAVIPELAVLLDLQPTRIADVLSFYTLFYRQPTGRYHIQVCRTLSCHSRGASELLAYLESRCGAQRNQGLSPDGRFSIETVECLGACTGAPAILVNGELIDHITPDKLNYLIDRWTRES